MNKLIWVKTKCDSYYKLVNKLNKIDIKIYEIKYVDKILYLRIKKKDYEDLSKYIISYKFDVISSSLLKKIKLNKIYFISLIIGLVVFFIVNKMIIKINIIHENAEIRELIKEELDTYGIKVLRFKKSYQELEQIREEILDKYPSTLDWMEFEVKGMVLNVHIEERIITEISEDNKLCDVVALKDAVITDIKVEAGEIAVNINDYVHKGDILIKGSLVYNDEEKRNVCAKGEVYGTVYYTGTASIPYEINEKQKTGKVRYNLGYEYEGIKTNILRSRLSEYTSSYKTLLKFFDFKIYLEKEEDVLKKKTVLSKSEVENLGVEKVIEAIMKKNLQKMTIIDRKVLKKVENNSTMDIEVFVVAKELISTQEEKD